LFDQATLGKTNTAYPTALIEKDTDLTLCLYVIQIGGIEVHPLYFGRILLMSSIRIAAVVYGIQTVLCVQCIGLECEQRQKKEE
jgi:hypothetical protein